MPIVVCANCQAQFEKTTSQIKQSRNHFCSRSCAAQVNNRLSPKRSKTGACRTCGASVPTSRTYCGGCWILPKPKPPQPAVKTCPRCEQLKSVAEFYTKNRASGTTQQFCKVCFNAYCINRWKQRKKKAVVYMGGRCNDCHGVFHPNVYDFHHLRDKDCVWDQLRLRSWDQVTQELDKCVLLCANCHRMRHVEEEKTGE